MAGICAENDLLEAKTNKYGVPPELAISFCQTQLMAYEEISWMTMDNSSSESKGFRFRSLLERAYAELSNGIWLDHALEVTTARKAA